MLEGEPQKKECGGPLEGENDPGPTARLELRTSVLQVQCKELDLPTASMSLKDFSP